MLTGKGVEIRGCAETCALLPAARPATEEDYFTEYLAPIISVKVVTGIDEAIAHINHYSSKHTEAIVTDNHPKAFLSGPFLDRQRTRTQHPLHVYREHAYRGRRCRFGLLYRP